MLSKRIIQDINDEIIPDFKSYLNGLAGKKIFITGGDGFIASYLVDTFVMHNKLIERPCKLIVADKNPITEKSRLSHLLEDPNVTFISCDVGKPFKIPEKVDIIIHAASRANPKAFLEDPIDTIDANVNGVRTLLEYAKENPIEQFIFFSTNEIYGNPLPEFIPTPETYPGNIDCTDPRSCYAGSKRFSETLCMTFYRQFNVPVKIIRILLAYGPGMKDDGKVITDFFHKGISDKKIALRDKGTSLRSFCYISDVVKEILKVMSEGKLGEVYNIGNDLENISIRHLAETIAKIMDNNIIVKVNDRAIPKEIYGVDNRHPNLTKIRNLGVEPKVLLEEGLKRLREHFIEIGYARALTAKKD